MIYFWFGFILICNILAARKKRINSLVLLMTVVFIMLFWVGNTDGPDIRNYMNNYVSINSGFLSSSNQILYYGSMNILRQWGLTFYQYRFVMNIISLILMLIALYMTGTNVHFVLSLYFLQLLFLDGIQIRNYAAIPFLLLGFVVLIKQVKHWRIIYTVFVIIASMFHVSFWVYLIFLFIPTWQYNKKRMLKIHAAVGIIITAIVFRFRGQMASLVAALNLIDSVRASGYTSASTDMGALIPIGLQICGIYITWYVYNRMEKYSLIYTDDEELLRNTNYCKFIFWINLLACYLLPFSIVQLTFYRLIRNILLVNFVTIGIGRKYFRGTKLALLTITYIGIWIVAEFVLLNSFENVVFPFFESNMYF